MKYTISILTREMNMLSKEQNRILLASDKYPGNENTEAIAIIKSRYLELSNAIDKLTEFDNLSNLF